MKFIGILLREGRKEDLKKKYSEKFSDEDLDFVLNISDLQDFNHKYTDFILKNLKSDNLYQFIEDLIRIVKDFDKYNSQLEKKDINQYTGFAELSQALRPIKSKEVEKDLEKQVDRIYEDDRFLVVIPKTQESSCKYGSNTKWCVTQKGTDHFKRYTSGTQKLYFIIDKKNSTDNSYSKIAVHFDNAGNPGYWDSQDHPMSKDKIELLNFAFPNVINAINDDFEKNKESPESLLKKVFDFSDVNHLGSLVQEKTDKVITVIVDGYENISDMPGHAVGRLSIDFNGTGIDSYEVLINYELLSNKKTFRVSVGFAGLDDTLVDTELEEKGFDKDFLLLDVGSTWNNFTDYLLRYVTQNVKQNQNLLRYITGDKSTFWKSKKLSYGYTFGKNKGLINKMVKWLDSGKSGTRLDFLTDIGKFEKIEKDGKTFYRRTGYENQIYKPTDLRGQHSSFFASAVLAGIIKNEKRGGKFYITKGPNFEAFKSGELKAF